MTAIAAYVDDSKCIYMGGDSASARGSSVHRCNRAKVFRKGNFIFGFTSSWRMADILQYSLVVPPQKIGQSLDEYLASDFSESVRSANSSGGYMEVHNSAEFGGTFLFGTQGRLFCMLNDYAVLSYSAPFHAVGCGQDLCLGSMFAMYSQNKNQDGGKMVRVALEAADAYSGGVTGPFTIMSLSDSSLENKAVRTPSS